VIWCTASDLDHAWRSTACAPLGAHIAPIGAHWVAPYGLNECNLKPWG